MQFDMLCIFLFAFHLDIGVSHLMFFFLKTKVSVYVHTMATLSWHQHQINFILLVENRFYLITALVDIEMKPGAISSLRTVLVLLFLLTLIGCIQ